MIPPSFEMFLEEAGHIPDVLYHVTFTRRMESIQDEGLVLYAPKVFTHYAHNSTGRIFLTSPEGVDYWRWKIDAMEFDQYDDPQGLTVLTLDVRGLDVKIDPVGTTDAGHPAYYVEEPIDPERIVDTETFKPDF